MLSRARSCCRATVRPVTRRAVTDAGICTGKESHNVHEKWGCELDASVRKVGMLDVTIRLACPHIAYCGAGRSKEDRQDSFRRRRARGACVRACRMSFAYV